MKLGPLIAAIASGVVVLGIGVWARARGRIGAIAGKETDQGLVTVRDSVIYGPGGAQVPITDADALWLARAITGEVGARRSREARAAVAWALAQNLMLVRSNASDPPRFPTFSRMITAYCQPVNPLWRDPDGAKCRQNPSSCTPEMIARRRRYATMTWSDISDEVRETVEEFRAGRLPNPVVGLVDWHARPFPEATVQIGGNHFGNLSFRPILV